jgi:hypothetical protein
MAMWQEVALVFAPFILPLILMGLGHDIGTLEEKSDDK